jgi:geranylgeranylglycerol-phosphate geranylgeranyltransferase
VLGAAAVVRPGNVLLSAAAVLVGGMVASGVAVLWPPYPPLLLAAAVAGLVTAAGNALNDYYDAETDRVNHPDRPIPSGSLSRPGALRITAVLFAVGVLLALLLSLEAFAVVLVNLAALVAYEARFKARGGSGNLLIAYLVGSLFLFAAATTWRGDSQAFLRGGLLALLAFLATLGREVAKDIEDAAGDVDRRTLPHTLGVAGAGAVASAAFLLSVAWSAAPFLLGVLPLLYLLLVLPADAVFLYCALFAATVGRRAGKVSKYGMVIALVAFLAGALA